MSGHHNHMARVWLARSLAATGPALRALAGDPDLIAAGNPPTDKSPPTVDELHAAAAVIERVATCLRHGRPVEETAS